MKIMKRLMAIIAVLMVIPFVNVNAKDSYELGELSNFIKNSEQEKRWKELKREDVGQRVNMTGRTYPGDDQYVEAFVSGFVGIYETTPYHNGFYTDLSAWRGVTEVKMEDSAPYKWLAKNFYGATTLVDPMETPYVKDWTVYNNARIPTMDDFTDLGVASGSASSGYTVSVEQFDKLYSLYSEAIETNNPITNKKYTKFFTGSIRIDNTDPSYPIVWGYILSFDDIANKVATFTEIKLNNAATPSDSSTGEGIAMVPIMYFNKDYDCHNKTEDKKKTYCYECDGKYVWKVEGTQATTCKKVENNKCNPDTGVESYAAELGIAAGICVIALVVLKRKELFNRV